MTAFAVTAPGETLFGRGCRSGAAARIAALGRRILLVRGRSVAWVDVLVDELRAANLETLEIHSSGEPTVARLREALSEARAFQADCVVAVGGGAALDLGKAISALIGSGEDPVRHLEVIGEGLPIGPDPLPLVAIPTTSGTGAEATRNAVLTVPEHALKVSLRDHRMLPALAIVDPALTDGTPAGLTLATGLDAITQLIESYLSRRANPVTDALCRDTIPGAVAALSRLMEAEDAAARDSMARASYLSGLALASAGLGIVHGLAAVIGGRGGAHGAICGRLLPAALDVNREATRGRGLSEARFLEVDGWLRDALGGGPATGTAALRAFADANGLPGLDALGCPPEQHEEIARQAMQASSTKANPVELTAGEIGEILSRSG